VFKTAREIHQQWIIAHAADRGVYIDQAQSVNLFFEPTADIEYLHHVHFSAWKKGLKGLYYCRSAKLRTPEKIGQKVERIKIVDDNECIACEG
jgi:ribonucleoside-diphosphate reductase alpha chain